MTKIEDVTVKNSNFGSRAMAAYFRTGGTDQPSGTVLEYTLPDGRSYHVLENVRGILAVYRYRPDNDRLRSLKRWPAVLDQIVTGEKV